MNADERRLWGWFSLFLLQPASVCVYLWLQTCPAVAQSFLWWEAEDTRRTDVPNRSPFRPGTGGDFNVLSGGDWLSGVVKAGGDPVGATYTLDVPEAGTYQLWARKFWKHGPFRWRFDGNDWQTAGRDLTLADSVTIRQHLVANWVALGEVELNAGLATFSWQLTDLKPGKDEGYGLDCFLLTQEPFTPRGKLKPNTRDGRAMPGHFAWDPPTDPFPPYPEEAGFDHRHLNEEFAGVNGRVRKTDDGNGFVLGDGTPARFWGVNLNPEQGGAPQELIDYFARRMAKLGVNLVRLHGPLWDENETPWRVSPEKIGRLHRLVAALKKQGIYTTISWYFPVWVDAKRAGLSGYEDFNGRHPFAAHLFDDAAQRFYFQSMRDIFTPVNPHTGLSLAEDPAVAMVELVNEDSFFFWTFSEKNVPLALWRSLQQRYEASPHYQSGELEGVWRMTRAGMKDASRRQQRRARAQAAFLADTQRGFYERAIRELRDLGYSGLTVCSNWHTADPPMLDALERWTYTAGDVIDHHGYFEAPHEGEGSAWSVRVGHTFGDKLALQHLDELPLRVNQVRGHPQMISEVNWPLPNQHRADMVWLGVAALGVQGVDAVCWFTCTSLTGVETDWSKKFTIDVPSITGQFPAAALAFRRGDVPEQEPVVIESLKSEDLKALSGSATANHASIEQLRAGDAGVVEGFDGVDPLAYYVGPVVRVYDDNKDGLRTRIPENSFHDKMLVASREGTTHPVALYEKTGALRLFADGLRTWSGDTQRVERTRLEPLYLFPSGQSASVIALDGESIWESRRLLATQVPRVVPYRWGVEGNTIRSLGQSPLNLLAFDEPGQMTWSSPLGAAYRLTRLDENGNRRGEPLQLSVQQRGERLGWSAAWPTDVVYLLIERVDKNEASDAP